MQKYKPFLAFVVTLSILILIVFGYTYLDRHWEDLFGPKAEEFCDFNVVDKTYKEEFIDNKTCYMINVNFEIAVKKTMYSVEVSPQECSDGVTIISFDDGVPATPTLKEGTVIRPIMSAQLENTSGWVEMRISFIDIDAHEKELKKTVDLRPLYPKMMAGMPGFESVFAIVGLLAVTHLLRRRKRG